MSGQLVLLLDVLASLAHGYLLVPLNQFAFFRIAPIIAAKIAGNESNARYRWQFAEIVSLLIAAVLSSSSWFVAAFVYLLIMPRVGSISPFWWMCCMFIGVGAYRAREEAKKRRRKNVL